jgi:hypothetical protein
MLARKDTAQSNSSALAPTNSDSVCVHKTSFYKSDSFPITTTSTDYIKIQPEKIYVLNSKQVKIKSINSQSQRNDSISESNISSNLLKINKNHKQIKLINEHNEKFTLKPILKNKNKKGFLRPVKRNKTEYTGKSIKFVDEVLNSNRPLVDIIVVESYHKLKEECEQYKRVIPEGKAKSECNCRCSIF